MLTLAFEGYFQCRFATDPDPSDEPRGISGPTFAAPGEPMLDRVIRLNDPVAIRWPRSQDFGVTVRTVSMNNQPLSAHPLIGAKVDLLDNPQYYQRNLILVDYPFQAPIDPFHLRIKSDLVTIQRQDCWDVSQPNLTVFDVYTYPTLMARRLNTIEINSATIGEATGALNYADYRAQRRQELMAQREQTTDPVTRAAYDRRITTIDNDVVMVGVRIAAEAFLGMLATYTFALNGAAVVDDPGHRLGGEIGRSQDWPLTFWMGGYDVDTMCGYSRGTLSIPFRPKQL